MCCGVVSYRRLAGTPRGRRRQIFVYGVAYGFNGPLGRTRVRGYEKRDNTQHEGLGAPMLFSDAKRLAL